MSFAEAPKWVPNYNPKIFLKAEAKDCLLPMGITSENVATRYKVSRKEQDELAVLSHERAAAAIKSGKFKDEIVPVATKVKDEKTGVETEIVFDTDDGVRDGTTYEALSKLPPAFTKEGTTTAGNSSQVSDGAAAVLAMTRRKANRLGLPVLCVFKSYAVAGVPPDVMGIGPAFAIPEAVKKAGLRLEDIDLFEINEAFASQAVYCVKHLGLSMSKVNVNGGAIALGHPLGCTGARMVSTLAYEMKRRNARYGVISMCIGSGMGAAAVFERS
jgi:acetyl-CoA acyltransferase 1